MKEVAAMRQTHKDAFFDAADGFTCWIGLREPNPLAERWIGRAGYTPKPLACKAKTADRANHRLGGLVVDPTLCPDAFESRTLGEAMETWTRKFLVAGRLPAGFTRVESGHERGLVRHQGAAIYADFDLMALLRSNADAEFLHTTPPEQKQLFDKIVPVLNRALGAPLIQHGAEFMWDQGVGARASEFVLWFGPGRRFERWPSSMPKGGH
jgi:hypothetical protein